MRCASSFWGGGSARSRAQAAREGTRSDTGRARPAQGGGRAEDSPEPVIGEAHPGLHAGGGREEARSESGGKAGRQLGGHGAPAEPLPVRGGQGLRSGEGRVGSAKGTEEEGEGEKRRAGGLRLLGVGSAAGVTRAPGATGPPAVALVVAGEGRGFSLCSKPLSPLSETPGPCLCRSALWPCPASSALARPQPLWSAPGSSRGRPPGSRADGWTGGPGWAVSGRWASLRPSRAAGPISVLGRANWAGGRLRGPHTTVLTEGSERLSGPVISVGWYCCKIEIHRQGGPSARRSGAHAGPGRVGRPAGRAAGGRARPGGGWGRSSPDPVVLRDSAWARPRSRPSVCLRGGGQSRAGGASQLSL